MKKTAMPLMALILIFAAARAAFPAGDPAPTQPLSVPASPSMPLASAAPSALPDSSVARGNVFPLLFLALAAVTAVAAVTALVLVIRDRTPRSSRDAIAAIPPLPILTPDPFEGREAPQGVPPAPPPVVKPAPPPAPPPFINPDLPATPVPTMVKPAPPPGPLPPNFPTLEEFTQLQPSLTGAVLTEACRLTKATTRIGRVSGNEVVIPHNNVSSLHATIDYRDGSFYLEDQRSANGTRLNDGKPLKANQPVLLKNGDRIQFATHELKFFVKGGTLIDSFPPPLDPDLPSQGGTIVKGSCPNHPAWQARELCDICKHAFCPQCVMDVDGKTVCVECSEKAAASTPRRGSTS